jgi:hypothetical protein
MEFWLALVIATIIICCLLLFSKIYIDVTYKRNGVNDYISVNVYTVKKLVAYQMEVPVIKLVESKGLSWIESTIKTVQSQDTTHRKREKRFMKKTAKIYSKHPKKLKYAIKELHYYTQMYCRVIDKVLQSAICEKFYWKTVYGSEDAANTGIVAGLLWTGKVFVINRLKRHIVCGEKPIIAVNPIFGRRQFDVDFQCIFSIRLGNVIKTIKSIYNIKK